mgnify:FL=1
MKKSLLSRLRTPFLIAPLVLAAASPLQAAQVKDLEFGGILFDYYQQEYFSALVQYEYAASKNALQNHGDEARLMKGGMALSYGLAQQAEKIFNELLTPEVAEPQRNRAWFYLAKLYYQKADTAKAAHALVQIGGNVPADIAEEYNYLATLINISNSQMGAANAGIEQLAGNDRLQPYLIYNYAIRLLKNEDTQGAIANLSRLLNLIQQKDSKEMKALADRARHALARLSLNEQNYVGAWNYLQGVSTTGLYSNRALLTYAWAAIKMEQYPQAVPALQLLTQRSISIPETQEAKVLLAHVFETQGAKRSALKQYLLAEKDFKGGLEAIEQARKVIATQEIPQEFVINLEAMLDESDWYGMQPTLDYNKLTPFLTELMASNNFYSVIKELRDLYGLRRNLEFWQMQVHEHELIIRIRREQTGVDQLMAQVKQTQNQFEEYRDGLQELKLMTLTLPEWDQERFTGLWENTMKELGLVEDKVDQVASIKTPYRLSYDLEVQSKVLAKEVNQELNNTNQLIRSLEKVMRSVITAELDKHEERIRYYWAQARLGKARLYDKALNNIDDTSTGVQ